MRITSDFVFFHSQRDIYSQWNMSFPFQYHGIDFKSCEHWMMVKKLVFFVHRGKSIKEIKSVIDSERQFFEQHKKHPKNSIYRMLVAPTPKAVKWLGRDVTPFNKEEWDAIAPDVILQGNHLKFTQNPRALETFRSHYGKRFVEASKTDTIYGVGLDENHPNVENPDLWRGQNVLGEALTELSHQLFGIAKNE